MTEFDRGPDGLAKVKPAEWFPRYPGEHARRLPIVRDVRRKVYDLIDRARDHQDEKFGWIGSAHPMSALPAGDDRNDRKLAVLLEEVGEVARVLNDAANAGAAFDREALHHELAQVAACAVAWIEADLELGRGEDRFSMRTIGQLFGLPEEITDLIIDQHIARPDPSEYRPGVPW